MARFLLVALVLVSGVACAPSSAGARRQFAAASSCPEDRVTVTTQRGRPLSPAPPSDAVRGDPARLAMWEQQQARARRIIQDNTYYVASGCGAERTYFCVRTEESTVACTAVLPGAVLTLGFPGWPDAI